MEAAREFEVKWKQGRLLRLRGRLVLRYRSHCTPSPGLTWYHTNTTTKCAYIGAVLNLLFSPLIDLAFERMVGDQVCAKECVIEKRSKEGEHTT